MMTELDAEQREWLDELTLELRLRDVGGRDVGEAVAAVREFLVDSGQPAGEAFGTPQEYAAALALAPVPDAGRRTLRSMGSALVAVVGLLAVSFAGGAAWRGEEFELDAAVVVLTVGTVVLVLATPWLFEPMLRARPWQVAAAFGVFFAMQAGVALVLGGTQLATVPAWPVATVGSVMLVASLGWAWLADPEVDPVVEPLASEPTGGHSRALTVLPQLLMCVAAVVFVVIDVLAGS